MNKKKRLKEDVDPPNRKIKLKVPTKTEFSMKNSVKNSEIPKVLKLNNTQQKQVENHANGHVSRPPPIITTNKSYEELCSLLEQSKIKEYNLKIISIGVKIHLYTNESHQKCLEHLTMNQTQFYTFDTQETKIVRVVVYGLPKISLERIKDSLTQAKASPYDIKNMISKNDKNPNRGLYMIYYVKKSKEFDCFKNLKSICQVIFRWRYYVKPPNAAPQCHKCLTFGHGSKNCHKNPKCLLCAEDHLTENCTNFSRAQVSDESKFNSMKCANCLGNHPANYRDCPKKHEYIKIQENIKNKKKPIRKIEKFELEEVHAIETHINETLLTPDNSTLKEESANAKEDYPSDQLMMSPDESSEFIIPCTQSIPKNQNFSTYASTVKSHQKHSLESRRQSEDKKETLFNSTEIYNIFIDLCNRLSRCKSKIDQIAVISEVTSEYIFKEL